MVYKRGFGQRTCVPRPTPMTTDTVFDLASMTKVVATTTAVMQLVDAGRLRLDDPAAKYWPEFAANGKGRHHHPAADDAHLGAAGRRQFPCPLVGL